MKLLDTNVVIYAMGRDHPYREPCRAIVNQLSVNTHDYAVDAEALQELLYVFSNRGDIATGIGAVSNLMELFVDVIPISAVEILGATRLLEQTSRLSVRDAIHAAVVFEYALEGIVSADRDFDEVAGLRRFDPGELADG